MLCYINCCIIKWLNILIILFKKDPSFQNWCINFLTRIFVMSYHTLEYLSKLIFRPLFWNAIDLLTQSDKKKKKEHFNARVRRFVLVQVKRDYMFRDFVMYSDRNSIIGFKIVLLQSKLKLTLRNRLPW